MAALAIGCGDDGATDGFDVDAGDTRDSGTTPAEDMGITPWIPDGFPAAVEALSLVVRASGPILPLAEELRDDSLTITTFEETKSHFDAAIRERLDGYLFESSCSAFEDVSSGQIGAGLTHSDCALAFGGEMLSGDVLLIVQPRAGGLWSGSGRWQSAGDEWVGHWTLIVGGDCAPGAERCECTHPYCGATVSEWSMRWEESGSRSWGAYGNVRIREGVLQLHAPGGFQDDPRTFEADLREALEWQPGECLPSAGQLFIIDYADRGINETIDFLPTTPVDGSIRVTDIDGVEATVSVFDPCP